MVRQRSRGGTDISVGDLIEVEVNSSLYATVIELEAVEDEEFHDEEEAEVEGIVSGFTSTAATFTVGSTTVQVTDSTEYEGGDVDILRGER